MVKKILFVCKYNRFRSKFAEAYFNSINRNKNVEVSSAGIIEMNRGLLCNEKERNKYALREFGIRLGGESRGMTVKLLEDYDEIIVVAKDVPKVIFDYPKWRDKVVTWEIPDELNEDRENINKILNAVKEKVNILVKRFEVKK